MSLWLWVIGFDLNVSESINIYKITFYALNSILIRITGYLLFLGFLFNTLLNTTTILDNLNLKYILFYLMIKLYYIRLCKISLLFS